jgi:N-acetylmuramoyl-L-alanine amidase
MRKRGWPLLRALIAPLLAVVLGSGIGYAEAADGRFRVCLDPGHGGRDPGAIAGNLVEMKLNLDIAQRLAAELGADYDVLLTRTDNDTTLGNSERAQICNAFGAQVVLSIHLNASTDTSIDYVWFFYGKPSKDKAFTATMDKNYLLPNPSGEGLLRHNTITNFANGTLLRSKAPASLAECLFMTHTRENELLAATDDTSRRQQIAEHLAAGIRAFAGP